jgi:aminocarboxymuconate-semialdehyde decarboxylase
MAGCATLEPVLVRQAGGQLVVDIHAHLNVAVAENRVRQEFPDLPRSLPFSCPASDAVNGRMFQAIGSRLNGVPERLADMDRMGVDVQALSPNPGQYYYFTEPGLGRELAQLVNDGIAEAVAQAPDRLVGIGTVPLQDPQLAIEEMRRCLGSNGLRGIEIGTTAAGRELADPALRPFLQAAEELDVLLLVHPLGFTHGQRLTEHYLNNLIGNPLESTIALSHLVFGGVLEQMPGLKLCVVHGGGYLPAYWGRMDHAFRSREDCRQHITRAPSTYLKQVWFDTLVFDRRELASLVQSVGAERLCLGTDYPFDMSEPDPVGFVSELEPAARLRVLGLNAAGLLGLASTRTPGPTGPTG